MVIEKIYYAEVNENTLNFDKRFNTFDELTSAVFKKCDDKRLCAKIIVVNIFKLIICLMELFYEYSEMSGCIQSPDKKEHENYMVQLLNDCKNGPVQLKIFVEYFTIYQTSKRVTLIPVNILEGFKINRPLKGKKIPTDKKANISSYVTSRNISKLWKNTESLFNNFTNSEG